MVAFRGHLGPPERMVAIVAHALRIVLEIPVRASKYSLASAATAGVLLLLWICGARMGTYVL